MEIDIDSFAAILPDATTGTLQAAADTRAYNDLFAVKLDLFLRLGETTNITWQGNFRPPLTGQGDFPRPYQARLPLWVGVGGTQQSFVRTGVLGLPLKIAIIDDGFGRYRPLVDLYRDAGKRAGHRPERLMVGVHAKGFVARTNAEKDVFFTDWAHLTETVGRERGWSPPTRRQFDDLAGPEGALLIGGPKNIDDTMLVAKEALGGISRVTFRMSTASLDAAKKQSIQLLGAEAAPIARSAGAMV